MNTPRLPALTLPTLDGGDLDLGAAHDRRLLLFAWASW